MHESYAPAVVSRAETPAAKHEEVVDVVLDSNGPNIWEGA